MLLPFLISETLQKSMQAMGTLSSCLLITIISNMIVTSTKSSSDTMENSLSALRLAIKCFTKCSKSCCEKRYGRKKIVVHLILTFLLILFIFNT